MNVALTDRPASPCLFESVWMSGVRWQVHGMDFCWHCGYGEVFFSFLTRETHGEMHVVFIQQLRPDACAAFAVAVYNHDVWY